MAVTRRRLIGTGAVAGLMAAGPGHAAGRSLIEVSAPEGAGAGTLRFGGQSYPCALGRAGIVLPKYEGDGGTPAGLFPLREVRYRPDRMAAPKTGLPLFKASQADGWCDDPADPSYNRLVALPHMSGAEPMWRDDAAYDVLAVIGYNDAPVIPGAGSAVFLHVARPNAAGDGFEPTAGCIALKAADLLTVLAACGPASVISIRIG
jgi:L,D-peptidoglycan transpeptidase YkuD (ErfK/YbiS/YcfS/YnhG family)